MVDHGHMTTATVLHVRLPTETRDQLRDHAHDIGRTLSQETTVWLEAGAALSVYAATIDPRTPLKVPDPVELDEMRRVALLTLRDAMARALPTCVADDVIASHAMN